MLLAILSGIATAAAHPPIGAWWAAPIGIACLTLAVLGTTVVRGTGVGALAGIVHYTLLLEWTRAFGPDAYAGLVGLGTFWTAALGASIALLTRLRAWPLLVAAAWIATEAAYARVPFGGFPWGQLAASQAAAPTVNAASIVGAAGLGALIALSGTLLAAAIAAAHERRGIPGALLIGASASVLAVTTLAGHSAGAIGPATNDTVRLAVVQGGLIEAGGSDLNQAKRTLERYRDLTAELSRAVAQGDQAPVAAVIWPENSANADPINNAWARGIVQQAAEAAGVPLLVGASVSVPGGLHNSAIVWDTTGSGQQYTKKRLVPFGEYLPLRHLLGNVAGGRFTWLARDFLAGQEPPLLTLGGVPAGIGICFEVAHGDVIAEAVRRGGRLLVIPTNNALWSPSGGVEQQFSIARLRAVEHGRSVVSAATTGITAVVDPQGHVQAQLEREQPSVLVVDIALRDALTPGTQVGGTIEAALVVLAVAALAAAGGQELRRRQAGRARRQTTGAQHP